jgi:hypothetical protein
MIKKKQCDSMNCIFKIRIFYRVDIIAFLAISLEVLDAKNILLIIIEPARVFKIEVLPFYKI